MATEEEIEVYMNEIWKQVSKEPVEWYEVRELTEDEKKESTEFWGEVVPPQESEV